MPAFQGIRCCRDGCVARVEIDLSKPSPMPRPEAGWAEIRPAYVLRGGMQRSVVEFLCPACIVSLQLPAPAQKMLAEPPHSRGDDMLGAFFPRSPDAD